MLNTPLLFCESVVRRSLFITKQQWTVEAEFNCYWCRSRRLMMRRLPRERHIFPAHPPWFNTEVVSADLRRKRGSVEWFETSMYGYRTHQFSSQELMCETGTVQTIAVYPTG